MKTLILASAAILALSTAGASARDFSGVSHWSPDSGQAMQARGGPVITTGRFGALQSTTLPAGGGTGVLVNNGDGTGTVFGSNGTITSIPTP